MKRSILIALTSLLWSGTVQAYHNLIEYALPRGSGRGETVKVRIYGTYLEDPAEAVFHGTGIQCLGLGKAVPMAKPEGFPGGGKADSYVEATLQIAPDCPLGEHLLRLRTKTLLSEPVTFWVGPFPTVRETETKLGENDTPEKAQLVPLNSTVNGQIQSGSNTPDRDCFAVELKKGQRLSAELESVQLGTLNLRGENDCQIRILAPNGKELATCDDTVLHVQDPLLTLLAPDDGRYVVEVSQKMHMPSDYCYYRLHLGNFPRPTTVYPLGGRPGEKLDLLLQGDAAGSTKATVALPAETKHAGPLALFRFEPSEKGVPAPSPLPMRLTSHPNVLRAGGLGDKPQAFSIPAALNGIISKDGMVDQWRFHANKGDRLDLRVFASSMGTPLDPKIWIRSATKESADKPLLQADDASLAERGYWAFHTHARPPALLDPATTFSAPDTGDYILGVEDTRGIGGPEFIYRIEINPHVDGVHPYVMGMYNQKIVRETDFVVPCGNRWTLSVSLGEDIGTKLGTGEYELEALGLPPGVTMIASRYPKGVKQMPVQFVAAPDAKPGVSFIKLIAKAVNKSPVEGSCQQGFTYTDRRSQFAWWFVQLDEFALAVVDPAPFRIETSAPSVAIAKNSEVTLNLKIERLAGWNEPLEIQTDWLPAGVEKGPPVSVPAGQNTAQLHLHASDKAAAGKWPITVTATTVNGEVQSGAGCRLVSSPVITLEVSEPYLSVNFQRAAIERGQKGELIADLKQNKPFPGKATASLLRLPNGVKLLEPLPQISATDKTCVFKVEVTADALVGQAKEISAEITFTENGQSIRQQSGSGVLRIDPSRGAK